MTAEHDCGADAAAYALGVLGPAEADAFRGHLESCSVCRDEVAALEGVVQALAMTAPQRPAPPALRRRVLHAVRAEPKSGSPRSRSTWNTGTRWPTGPSPAAAALALAVAIVVAVAVVPGSSTRVVEARVSGVAGTAQVRVVNERGELVVRRLSAPPAGHIYEVWLKAPRSAPVPAGVLFSVTSAGTADLKLPASLRGIREMMVTAEPDGGSQAPTHSPVIVARLS